MQSNEKSTETSGVVQVEVYYHTRRAAEFHPNLYAQATIFPNQESVSALSRLGLYEKAALIEVPAGIQPEHALEVAYKKTQNIHDSWTKNEGVTAITPTPRSSMLGDVFVIKGQPYTVACIGFDPLESFEKPAELKKTAERRNDNDGPSL